MVDFNKQDAALARMSEIAGGNSAVVQLKNNLSYLLLLSEASGQSGPAPPTPFRPFCLPPVPEGNKKNKPNLLSSFVKSTCRSYKVTTSFTKINNR